MQSNYIKVLLIAAFSLTGLFAKAQDGLKPSLSIGPDFAIPINTTYANYRQLYKNALGVNAKLELPVLPVLKVTLSAGYVSYGDKTVPELPSPYGAVTPEIKPDPYRFIPVKAGLQYYYAKYFYAAAEAGASFKANHDVYNSFIWSVGTGATVPFDKHNALDFSVRYESGYKIEYLDHAMSQIDIRLAYKYNF